MLFLGSQIAMDLHHRFPNHVNFSSLFFAETEFIIDLAT